ncbi:MAG: alpha/beta fold hydrolase, partial [Pseudomonadota bacterium]
AMARSTEPFGRAEQVTHDIDRTVDWIRNRHGVNQIALVGGSWGSVTSALYASDLGCEKVARLVLYAPIFAERNADWLALLGDPNDQTRFNPDFGASRLVSETQIRQRWDAEIRADMPTEWRDEAVVRAVVDASLDDDPESRGRAGPAFQVPNGAFADLWFCFNGIPIYDPASIRCPVLLLRGGDDTTSTRTDAMALLDHLGTSDKRYVEIATGSHFASAERNAGAYFATANAFLGEHAVNSQRFDRPD